MSTGLSTVLRRPYAFWAGRDIHAQFEVPLAEILIHLHVQLGKPNKKLGPVTLLPENFSPIFIPIVDFHNALLLLEVMSN